MAKKSPDTSFDDEGRRAAEAEIVDRSKRIEFFQTEFSIELLVQRMDKGTFVVPPYQRSFVWEPRRQSRFIESLLMGLQIPFMFFWEMPSGKLEIVDGVQRLRTLSDWVNGKLRLSELDELTSLSYATFDDLHEARRQKFLNRSIRGLVLNEHADEQARFDMFDRINTGSKSANSAEIRRGALGGPFLDLVVELSDRADFAKLAPVPDRAVRQREREELVTRFFAYGDGLAGYKDRPAAFAFEYTKRMNEKMGNDPSLAAVYRKRFDRMVAFVGEHIPNGFRKTSSATVTPRVRYEALAIGTGMALRDRPDLVVTGPIVPVEAWIESAEFKQVTTSDGANVIAKLRNRTEFVAKRLQGL